MKIHMAGDINSPNCISSRCRALFKAGLNDHEFKISNIKPDGACVMLEASLLEQVQKACEMNNVDVLRFAIYEGGADLNVLGDVCYYNKN